MPDFEFGNGSTNSTADSQTRVAGSGSIRIFGGIGKFFLEHVRIEISQLARIEELGFQLIGCVSATSGFCLRSGGQGMKLVEVGEGLIYKLIN